ncbi:MAG: hypothetical protein KC488_13550, partial [Candidatus Cloacimonetes bacterium]|nr:hypothetical protein [Candidatus Cloacimonadota bacterium]
MKNLQLTVLLASGLAVALALWQTPASETAIPGFREWNLAHPVPLGQGGKAIARADYERMKLRNPAT